LLDLEGGLLSYLFGLGKTPVALAWAEDLIECGEADTGWVVCEPGLKYQWLGQEGDLAKDIKPSGIKGFTDSPAIVIDGTPEQRRTQYAEAKSGKYRYIVLGYPQLVDEWRKVMTLPRDFIIADEITAIKNPQAARSKVFYDERKAPKLWAPRRLGLTGAPIENKIEDAYFILRWIDPEVFGPPHVFEKVFIERDRFGNVIECKDPRLFNRLLSQVMVRHEQTDVEENLPEISGGGMDPRWIKADRDTADLYHHVADALIEELDEAKRSLGRSFNIWAHYAGHKDPQADMIRGRVMSKLLCLRMLCDHPDLLHVSADKHVRTEGKHGAAYAAVLKEAGSILPPGSKSPKEAALLQRVSEILGTEERSKVVVFTNFYEALQLLEQSLSQVAPLVTYHGSKNAKAKDVAKRQFLEDPATRIFLSTDAGGYGLDLPAADHLINFDLPWGAGKHGQRNARIVRMSSQFAEVRQEALLIDGSIEEWMLDIIEVQLKTSQALVDGEARRGSMDVEIRSLSKFLANSSV